MVDGNTKKTNIKYDFKNECIIFNNEYINNNKEIDVSFFWNRLQALLNIDLIWNPKIYLFNDEKLWNEFVGEYEGCDSTAIYHEYFNIVGFNINNFKDGKNKYKISYEFIYHELVHAIQFLTGFFKWVEWQTSLVEGSADILSNILTNNTPNFEYVNESINIWYLCKYVLKLNNIQFYLFIRNYCCNDNFFDVYFSNNTKFLKHIKAKHNYNIIEFFEKINKKKLFNVKYKITLKHEFIQDILALRNIVNGKYIS